MCDEGDKVRLSTAISLHRVSCERIHEKEEKVSLPAIKLVPAPGGTFHGEAKRIVQLEEQALFI